MYYKPLKSSIAHGPLSYWSHTRELKKPSGQVKAKPTRLGFYPFGVILSTRIISVPLGPARIKFSGTLGTLSP